MFFFNVIFYYSHQHKQNSIDTLVWQQTFQSINTTLKSSALLGAVRGMWKEKYSFVILVNWPFKTCMHMEKPKLDNKQQHPVGINQNVSITISKTGKYQKLAWMSSKDFTLVFL